MYDIYSRCLVISLSKVNIFIASRVIAKVFFDTTIFFNWMRRIQRWIIYLFWAKLETSFAYDTEKAIKFFCSSKNCHYQQTLQRPSKCYLHVLKRTEGGLDQSISRKKKVKFKLLKVSSHRKVFFKKIFAEFTMKHLCRSLFSDDAAGLYNKSLRNCFE